MLLPIIQKYRYIETSSTIGKNIDKIFYEMVIENKKKYIITNNINNKINIEKNKLMQIKILENNKTNIINEKNVPIKKIQYNKCC
jgi:hypothetical protein